MLYEPVHATVSIATDPCRKEETVRGLRQRIRARRATVVSLGAVAVLGLGSAAIALAPNASAAARTNVLVRGADSGKCLTPPAGNLGSATIQNCASQRWSTTDSGQITINGKCLDAKGEQTGNGTVVTIYACHGGSNQKWTVRSDGTIRGAQSGRCLDVKGASTTSSAPQPTATTTAR
jgi:hypothetical protein